MKHFNFDRHEVFTQEDRHFILDLISNPLVYKYQDSFHLKNMLYGLFDGYYYFDLEPMLAYAGIKSAEFSNLKNKIVESIN